MKAIFSECGTYRYTLHRKIPSVLRWVKPALFIMLNPSTADDTHNDPTIRRCISFAEREHCTELTVVNLFALRSTDPKFLKLHRYPIGPDNDFYIEKMIARTQNNHNGIIVAAWGASKIAEERGKIIIDKVNILYCLGTSQSGNPRHPLYVRRNEPLQIYK